MGRSASAARPHARSLTVPIRTSVASVLSAAFVNCRNSRETLYLALRDRRTAEQLAEAGAVSCSTECPLGMMCAPSKSNPSFPGGMYAQNTTRDLRVVGNRSDSVVGANRSFE